MSRRCFTHRENAPRAWRLILCTLAEDHHGAYLVHREMTDSGCDECLHETVDELAEIAAAALTAHAPGQAISIAVDEAALALEALDRDRSNAPLDPTWWQRVVAVRARWMDL